MPSLIHQLQMVWLVDFMNFSVTNISLKSAKEAAHVLQNHYPERLGVAILYNPPRIFEQFYKGVKPFLEPKTRKKVTSKRIMEELFAMDQLESGFGGNISESFDIQTYAQRMKEDDEKMRSFWEEGNAASITSSSNVIFHEGSPSDDPTEEEDDEENGGGSTSSSAAESSLAATPDVKVSIAAMSLEDSEHGRRSE